MTQNAQPVKEKTQEEKNLEAKALKRQQDIDAILKNKLIPQRFKPMLISAIDMPDRIARLERNFVKLQPLIQLSVEAGKRMEAQKNAGIPPQQPLGAGLPSASGSPAPPNIQNALNLTPQQQAQLAQGGGSNMEGMLMRLLLGDQGRSSESTFFENLGKQSLLESFSFDRMMRRRTLRSMANNAYPEYVKTYNELAKAVKQPQMDITEGSV